MSDFREFLLERLEKDGFTTEDALASFLPLAREVVETHANGLVAPLEGIEQLRVEGSKIYFEESQRREPRTASAEVKRLGRKGKIAVDVISESHVTSDVDNGVETVVDLSVGEIDAPVTRPIYLPGFQTWEHKLECHDPLTDVFSLGMILASMICQLDLSQTDPLNTFIANRKNLFRIAPNLHPVVARAILRMTEINRHNRPQDIRSLIGTLENYHDQEVDFEFDLATSENFSERPKRDKQTVVLSKLRNRLFEISRRNRLLQFRATMRSVNLTHASVPLSFDYQNIRPDQILTWDGKFESDISKGKKVSIGNYVNFAEVLYAPSQLDRIIAETRRDKAEFGFAQLRLVICFLNWSNLKDKPVQQFESPLILVPVELKKQKGIRDKYFLEPTSDEAEINPVVRHQFRQLYDIKLPERIELTANAVGVFFDEFSKQIASTQTEVRLTKIDKPRIKLLHKKARRRLDQYRRKARLAGRGVRKYLDLDYSYDPANFHPLGLKLFSAKIKPNPTNLGSILEERPKPRTFAAPVAPDSEPAVVETEKQFFEIDAGAESNPYDWTFDLCNVTLANFKYRRMSLVRDYEELLENGESNPAFDAVFSLETRKIEKEIAQPLSLDDRYDVVPCDPTQAMAISEAVSGKNYIIQGPPGTGKSQTITNLIADFVARDKRVLFVCEKRAAIDVVFARLKQCGLDEVSCLIHDSQSDKKEFVLDLKQTYENFLTDLKPAPDKRAAGIEKFQQSVLPLRRIEKFMQDNLPNVGCSNRRLLERCLELQSDVPELAAVTKESLPDFSDWQSSEIAIREFQVTISDIGQEPIFAKHPLRILSLKLGRHEKPLSIVVGAARAAQSNLNALNQSLAETGIPSETWQRLDSAKQLIDYAERVSIVAAADKMSLLDKDSKSAKAFAKNLRAISKLEKSLAETQTANANWQTKLTPEETQIATGQAAAYEGAYFNWFKPGWWGLRKILNRNYNFGAHQIKPSWSHVLGQLTSEHEAQKTLADQSETIAEELEIPAENLLPLTNSISEIQKWIPDQQEWLQEIHLNMIGDPDAAAKIEQINRVSESYDAATNSLNRFADDTGTMTIDQLLESIEFIQSNTDSIPEFIDASKQLATLPEAVVRTLRTLPYSPIQIESAIANHSFDVAVSKDKELKRFSKSKYDSYVDSVGKRYDASLGLNAKEVRERVRRRFLKNVLLTDAAAGTLDAESKKLKKIYSKGRRILEHEFGKKMRYKAIRDLVSGDSGEVVKDLKPVWLMSPLSVSDTLPLDSEHFDVVIFDEASQITLEEAVPALFRAAQSIIVGDEMQLPPTDFFSAKQSAEDEEEMMIEHEGELVSYDLDSGSFLSHAAKNMASTLLGWHYRSRSESLISFSNWAFYDGRLLTVPDEALAGVKRKPISATQATDGAEGGIEALNRAVSFHSIPYGVYEKRRNLDEAEYIAELVRAVLMGGTGETIGVIAFSEAQQDEIERALARLAEQDKEFSEKYEAELEREEDDQFVGLLVKNLENIQGDERDLIILSVCYGRPRRGKMRMNFGPINKSGGEKRLNVAFSRAKKHMAIVSSIDSTEITNDYNNGANCLKNYLHYAQAVSTGQAQISERILGSLSRWQSDEVSPEAASSNAVADQLAARLVESGYEVDRSVGQSHFRCDLAIYKPGDEVYRLGILIDHPEYYEQADLLERDLMRPRLLRAFGWEVTHVFATQWHENSEEVFQELLSLIPNKATKSGD